MKAFALAILLAAGAARADNEISLSLGGGWAYELVGFNFAARSGHYEGYAGLGLLSALRGIALGGRYFFRDDGTGFFLGLNTAAHADTVRIDESDSTGGRLFWATLTPGYRATFGSFFLQAAIGGGVFYSITFWSTPPSPTKDWGAFPDAALALGFRFL